MILKKNYFCEIIEVASQKKKKNSRGAATYFLSHKTFKSDEQNTLNTAGEIRTTS